MWLCHIACWKQVEIYAIQLKTQRSFRLFKLFFLHPKVTVYDVLKVFQNSCKRRSDIVDECYQVVVNAVTENKRY